MHKINKQTSLYIAGILLVWIVCCNVGLSLFDSKTTLQKNQNHAQKALFNHRFGYADSALYSKAPLVYNTFEGNFNNPFMPESGTMEIDNHTKQVVKDTIKKPVITVKGILLKKFPIAILEGDSGKTYICGVNDTLKGMRIVKIEAAGVFVQTDHSGHCFRIKD